MSRRPAAAPSVAMRKGNAMSTASGGQGSPVRPFWSPVTAGVVLGLVLLLTFVVSGHGLGASGAFSHLVAWGGQLTAPEAAKGNGYLGPMLAEGHVLDSWITWEVLGVGLGAAVAAFMAGRFKVQVEGCRSIGRTSRLVRALAGGMLAGFGARVSAGCTSGLGLSGAAVLSISAFVFLVLFFATGLLVHRFARGE